MSALAGLILLALMCQKTGTELTETPVPHGWEAVGSAFLEFIVSEVIDWARRVRGPLRSSGFRQVPCARNDASSLEDKAQAFAGGAVKFLTRLRALVVPSSAMQFTALTSSL